MADGSTPPLQMSDDDRRVWATAATIKAVKAIGAVPATNEFIEFYFSKLTNEKPKAVATLSAG
jgi:hypothetical protein